MNNDIEKVLYSEEDIQAAIARLAKQVAADYQDKDPLIVSVLSGAVLFTVDLIKKWTLWPNSTLSTFRPTLGEPRRRGISS